MVEVAAVNGLVQGGPEVDLEQPLLGQPAIVEQIGVPNGRIPKRGKAIPAGTDLVGGQFPQQTEGVHQGLLFSAFALAGRRKRLRDHRVELVGNLADGLVERRVLVPRPQGIVRTRGDAFEQVAQNRFQQVAVDKPAPGALRENVPVHRVDAERGNLLRSVDRHQPL